MSGNIFAMDEMVESCSTPETKKTGQAVKSEGTARPRQSQPPPQVLLVFFDRRGLIYTHIVPRGATINVNCMMMA